MRSSSLSCIVFTLDSFYMKEAFIKLHLSILIAGGTGIFGKLISLNEGLLVWYRMMFASVMFFLLLSFLKKLRKVTLGDVTKIGSVGLLLALHWIFFYGSIKASNVSIGVVCLSLMSIFTAIFEPLINRHRISLREILFSLVAVLGIVLNSLPGGYLYGSHFVGFSFSVYHCQQEGSRELHLQHHAALRDAGRFLMALLHLAGLFALLSGFLYSARRPGFDLPALPGFGVYRGTLYPPDSGTESHIRLYGQLEL